MNREVEARAVVALKAMRAQPALAAQISSEIAAFYERHPYLERTDCGVGFLASLFLDELSTAADSQSAAQPTATKQVA